MCQATNILNMVKNQENKKKKITKLCMKLSIEGMVKTSIKKKLGAKA